MTLCVTFGLLGGTNLALSLNSLAMRYRESLYSGLCPPLPGWHS
jgi:hypothetical protein